MRFATLITYCKDTNLSSISIINSVKNSKSKEKNSIFEKKLKKVKNS